MARPEDILQAAEKVRKDGDPSAKLIINRAMNHIAQAASGAVLTSGFDHVVWVRPSWVHSPRDANQIKVFLGRKIADKDKYNLDDYLSEIGDEGAAFHMAFDSEAQRDVAGLMADEADNPGLDFKKVIGNLAIWQTIKRGRRSKYNTFRKFILTMVTPAGPRGLNPKKIQDLIRGLPGDRFVLDIDLDYFACDGTGRPPLVESSGRPPDHLRGKDLNQAIREEHVLIEDRIRRFSEILTRLLEAGKRPSIIILSDSSAVPVAYYDPCLEQVPTYTPISQVMYIRSLIFDTLFEVYGDHLSAAPGRRGIPGRGGRKQTKPGSKKPPSLNRK